jgi:hypothetical protein
MFSFKTGVVVAFSAAVLSFGLGACGGDGGSSVDGSKKLTDLTAEDQKALCEEGRADAQSHADALRKVSCYFAASFQGTCDESIAQSCISTPDGPDEETCNDAPQTFTSACTATVADLQACMDEQYAAFETAADGLTCANAEVKLGVALGAGGPKCQAAQQKCPEAFQSDDSNP